MVLELKLEGQLDRARAADLVERVEAAIRSSGTKAASQRCCRVAEQSIGYVVIRWTEIGVIEDVEELAAETKLDLLC